MVNEILFQLYILLGIILIKFFLEWQWPGVPHRYQAYFTGGVWVLFGIQILLYIYQLKNKGTTEAFIHIPIALVWAGYLTTQYRQVAPKTIHQPFSRVHDSELYDGFKADGKKNYIKLAEGLRNIDILLYRTEMYDYYTKGVIPGFSTQTNVLKIVQSDPYQTEDILEVVLKGIEIKLNLNIEITHEINNYPGGQTAIIKIIEEQVLNSLGKLIGTKKIDEVDNAAKIQTIIEDSAAYTNEVNKRLKDQGINVYKVQWVRIITVDLPTSYKIAKEAIINTGLKNIAAEEKLRAVINRLKLMPKQTVDRQRLQEMLTAEGVIQGYNFSGSHAEKINPLLDVAEKNKFPKT